MAVGDQEELRLGYPVVPTASKMWVSPMQAAREDGLPVHARVSRGAYDPRAASRLTDVDTGRETMTQQHFRDEVDINTIMRRYAQSGQFPIVRDPGVFADFSGITDYDSAVERLRWIESEFMKLDPEVRLKFDNNPGRMLELYQELAPEKFDELVKKPAAPRPEGDPPAS